MKNFFHVGLLICLFLCGCTSDKMTSVSYLLTPEMKSAPKVQTNYSVERVLLPSYLNRLEIIYRNGRRVMPSQYGCWGGSLHAMIRECLNENLRVINNGAVAAKEISVEIHRFEAVPEGFCAKGVILYEKKQKRFLFTIAGAHKNDDEIVDLACQALVKLATIVAEN